MSAARWNLERWVPRRLSQRLLLVVGVPLAFATLAALVVFSGLRATIRQQAELERINRVIGAIGDLRVHFLNAQNGARGYVLSGDEALLEPYERAVADRPATVAGLEIDFAGDGPQMARLQASSDQFEHWRREIAEPVIIGSRAVPQRHVAAAVDARARLIAFGSALGRHNASGTPDRAEVLEALSRLRDSVALAASTTTREETAAVWLEVASKVESVSVAAHRSLASATAEAARQQIAPAINQASELSMQRHWQQILPVVDALGNQFAQRMGALDQEMLAVARAHLARAVQRAERFQATAVAVAAASLALAISFGLTVALALARRLLIPIRSITRASEAIEDGDLSARAVAISDDEIGRLASRFNGMADRLERRNREVSSLHDLSQLLQTAGDAGEAFEIFERLAPVLFPGGSGTVHVISASRVELELRARFGSRLEIAAEMATPNDCWALRKGQTHLVESVERNLVCAHLGGRDGLRDPYACLPLVSQNETLGLLHVAFAEGALGGHTIESRREELEAIANALGLALGNLALREKLKSQSVRDALTGLYNRRFLEEALPRELERCRRRNLPLIVAMADLDHFKRLNDSWGHEAGDLAIQRFAEALRRSFRHEDILCRYGGEEFCLVLPECSFEDARRRCDQLLAQMRDNPIQFGRESVGPVTVSLGLVAFPDDATTVEQLIRAADAALYRAKQTGRDRIVKFHPKFVAA